MISQLTCGHSHGWPPQSKVSYVGKKVYCSFCNATSTVVAVVFPGLPMPDPTVNDRIVDMVFDAISNHPYVNDNGQTVEQGLATTKDRFRAAMKRGALATPLPSLSPEAMLKGAEERCDVANTKLAQSQFQVTVLNVEIESLRRLVELQKTEAAAARKYAGDLHAKFKDLYSYVEYGPLKQDSILAMMKRALE